MRPSAWSVSASVVHAVADWMRNNGPPLTQPRRREARTAADRLHEPGTVAGDLRLGAQHLERHSRDDDRLRAHAERRRADEPASEVAGADDRAVLDLDPGLQQVRLAEAVGVA